MKESILGLIAGLGILIVLVAVVGLPISVLDLSDSQKEIVMKLWIPMTIFVAFLNLLGRQSLIEELKIRNKLGKKESILLLICIFISSILSCVLAFIDMKDWIYTCIAVFLYLIGGFGLMQITMWNKK